MLRQQTKATEATGWHHVPLEGHVRFDKDTAQSVLETAARLQASDQNTLSQTELEAVAAEMGIAPRYVRQALRGTRGTQGALVLGNKNVPVRTREHMYVPLLYALCLCPFFALEHSQRDSLFLLLQMGMVLVMPFLLSLIAGFRLRTTASAALASGLNIIALLIGSYAGILMNQWVMFRMSSAVAIACTGMLIGSIIFGTFGSLLGRWWEARRGRPRLSPHAPLPALGDR